MSHQNLGDKLATRSCKDHHGKPAKLADSEVQSYLSQLNGWQQQAGEIFKTFAFKNYYETIAFVNATAWISHGQDHHPDLDVGYNKCEIRYTTHSVGGLSESDFICAAKVDALSK